MVVFLISTLLSYLSGSIPSAVWIGRLVRGIDIRQHGSGNPGAANAARVLGLPWGIAVGLVDVLKGFAPVFWLGPIAAEHSGLIPANAAVILGLAAIGGHLYPVFAGFKGGKGVLTVLGVFAALLPVEIAMGAAVWIIIFAVGRVVSLASLSAVAVFALAVLVRRFVFHVAHTDALVIAAVAVAFLVFHTHRSNIRRLRAGEEKRFRPPER
jgi:glycerol-3-phosphate acyltransferase PlsY